jgi:hypothetical protein
MPLTVAPSTPMLSIRNNANLCVHRDPCLLTRTIAPEPQPRTTQIHNKCTLPISLPASRPLHQRQATMVAHLAPPIPHNHVSPAVSLEPCPHPSALQHQLNPDSSSNNNLNSPARMLVLALDHLQNILTERRPSTVTKLILTMPTKSASTSTRS